LSGEPFGHPSGVSSLAHSARRSAAKARNSTILEALTRGGFVGYGLLHLAVGWLALQIAFGHGGEEGDQSGAFRLLRQQPFGRPLLIVVCVGLIAMALWQLLEAAIGHRDETGGRRLAQRLGSVARGVVYTALAWTAWRVQSGAPASSPGQEQQATAGVLAHPAGRFLVVLAGFAIVAVGVGMIVYGARRMFQKRLRTGRMGRGTRRATVIFGEVGYIAKGATFAIAGLLAFIAAVRKDAARSNGLDGALHSLAGKPFGQLLLVAVALGFAAFGVFCFLQARYRKV
jgi:hypothetical protein